MSLHYPSFFSPTNLSSTLIVAGKKSGGAVAVAAVAVSKSDEKERCEANLLFPHQLH